MTKKLAAIKCGLLLVGCSTANNKLDAHSDKKPKLTVVERPLPPIQLDSIPFDTTLDKLTQAEKSFISDLRMLKFAKKPETIWKISDGYLAAYDGGEFRGLLVHYNTEGSQRTFVLNDNVWSIAPVDESTYFCTGGVAHLENIGVINLVSRASKDSWATNRLWIDIGTIPSLRGRLENGNFLIRMSNPNGIYYEISPSGWMKQQLTAEVIMPPEVPSTGSTKDIDPNDPFAP